MLIYVLKLRMGFVAVKTIIRTLEKTGEGAVEHISYGLNYKCPGTA